MGGLGIEVFVGWQAELLRRLDPGAAGRMVVAQGRNAQRAVGAAILIGGAVEVLQLAEERKHAAVAPARSARALPVIEVFVLAANEDQPIDRTRPAKHPPARPQDAAPPGAFRRLRGEKAR